MKAAMHMEYESGMTTLEDLGVQAILTGQVSTVSQWDALVDKVTTAEVQAVSEFLRLISTRRLLLLKPIRCVQDVLTFQVAKKVINGKPSMASIGDLSETPYLDQLL